MAAKVVDASAVAALLFGEPAAERIAERLGSEPLFAPSLLRYEVGNVCVVKIRRAPGRRDMVREALRLLSPMGIQEVEVPIEEAVSTAESHDLTAYDAAYLWLSLVLDADLVTLDAALEQAWERERERGAQ